MLGVHHILVEVQSKYDDVLFTYKGENGEDVNFYKQIERNINWDVTVTGKSVTDYTKLGIKKGDDIAFSYSVIAEKTWDNAGSLYQLTAHTDGVASMWTDGEGNKLYKVKSPHSKIWDAYILDKKNDLIERYNGTEDMVERWLVQFNFSTNKGRFKHLFEIDQKDYWRVKEEDIIAKKNGDTIEMFHNQLLAKSIYADLTTRVEIAEGITLPRNAVQLEYQDMGMLVNDSPNLRMKQGDIVAFEQKFAQKYKMWGEHYLILSEKRILGKFE